MRAKDIMTTPVVTVPSDMPVKQVAAILVDRGISAVPVVNEAEELVGIVSEADLVPLETSPDPRRRISPTRWRRYRVPRTAGDAMTHDVVTLPEDADVSEAATLMLERRVKRIPIVAERRVVGIVSRRDVLKVLARTDSEVLREVSELLDDETLVLGYFEPDVDGGVVTLTGPRDPASRRLAELLARTVPGVIEVRFADPAASRPPHSGSWDPTWTSHRSGDWQRRRGR